MSISYYSKNLFQSEKIPSGIDKNRIESFRKQTEQAHAAIEADRAKDILGFYALPDRDISHILEFTNRVKADFDTMVVLGIGGSALGNKALYSALRIEKNLKKKLYVCDNVDPTLVYDILSQIELKRTLFNVITKSGTTAETMAAFLIIMKVLKEAFPDDYRSHVIITTDKEKGFLRKIIKQEGFQDFIVPDNVGGRFSVLTDVGLVSSAFVGIDIASLLKGAGSMRTRCENPDFWQNPAYLNGLLHYLYMQSGKNISVMMPYANPLYDMADWYRQLWAESLGKRKALDGADIYVGQTPVKALGTTDQHSQVQLYTEGPNDKVFTFLAVESFKHDYLIPNLYPENDEINYLGDQSLSRLLNMEQLATEIALTNAARPNATISFPTIDEHSLGEFIFMYEVQTVFTGKLLQIDPLDQPGVEAGKIATYALMGKSGFEEELAKIQSYIEQKK